MKKEYAVLYKRTRTGAIVFWRVVTHKALGGKPGWNVTKQSGQLGTENPIEHIDLITVGKQKRTAEEQADSEALSDWTRKHDSGYKSLDDLGITNHGDYYSKDGQDLGLAEMLEVVLPQFNTDANENVLPMLAPSKPWKMGDKKNKYPRQAETKFDGLRSTFVIEKTKSKFTTSLLSRTGKPYGFALHIYEAINKAKDLFPVGTTILDGEIYKHGWALSEINRAMKKYRPGITEQLEFWIYDVPTHPGNQVERSNAAKMIAVSINNLSIKFVSAFTVNNDEEVKVLHDETVQDGFEGLILKDPAGTYQQGQRSNFWTKVKMFDENEFEIIGAKIDKIPLNPDLEYGVTDKMIDSFTFTCKCKGGEFDPKPGGSRETRAEYINDLKNLIGKKLTVKHFGYTEYDIPFIPVGKAVRDYE